jgi:hypothetical protein
MARETFVPAPGRVTAVRCAGLPVVVDPVPVLGVAIADDERGDTVSARRATADRCELELSGLTPGCTRRETSPPGVTRVEPGRGVISVMLESWRGVADLRRGFSSDGPLTRGDSDRGEISVMRDRGEIALTGELSSDGPLARGDSVRGETSVMRDRGDTDLMGEPPSDGPLARGDSPLGALAVLRGS